MFEKELKYEKNKLKMSNETKKHSSVNFSF